MNRNRNQGIRTHTKEHHSRNINQIDVNTAKSNAQPDIVSEITIVNRKLNRHLAKNETWQTHYADDDLSTATPTPEVANDCSSHVAVLVRDEHETIHNFLGFHDENGGDNNEH